jgi:hypothetical protein
LFFCNFRVIVLRQTQKELKIAENAYFFKFPSREGWRISAGVCFLVVMKKILAKIIKYFSDKGWFDRVLRILEVTAIVIASCVIFQMPKQLHEWQNGQDNRTVDLLIKLDDKLKLGDDERIYIAIEKNMPVLKENGGDYSSDSLDDYLDDLCTVGDMLDRGLIKTEDVNNWFSDYFLKTYKNSEITAYVNESRKIDQDYFIDIDDTVNKLQNYNGEQVFKSN